ncbi:MAG: AAA family ATPase [gamma proteobacterium symbiont of Taylorina sp.]|nr:AAA family ATPase [gamma proteobacterium symbiont of Taylorina sp.]
MHTLKRNSIQSILSLLDLFPAVVLLGARQVGKSTQVKQILPDAHYFDLEKDSDYTRIFDDPELLFKEQHGAFIFDEAQRLPKLFQAIRVEVDRNRSQNGRFLITGSSSPELLQNITETLAGRCVIVEVNGFSWNEALECPQSEFYSRLEIKTIDAFKHLNTTTSYPELLDLCLYGS